MDTWASKLKENATKATKDSLKLFTVASAAKIGQVGRFEAVAEMISSVTANRSLDKLHAAAAPLATAGISRSSFKLHGGAWHWLHLSERCGCRRWAENTGCEYRSQPQP